MRRVRDFSVFLMLSTCPSPAPVFTLGRDPFEDIQQLKSSRFSDRAFDVESCRCSLYLYAIIEVVAGKGTNAIKEIARNQGLGYSIYPGFSKGEALTISWKFPFTMERACEAFS